MADMYGVRPVTHTRFCVGCDGMAVTTGICGPTNICDGCAATLTAFIRSEPARNFAQNCGSRCPGRSVVWSAHRPAEE